MSSVNYKTLLSYLPGMASVVNSFQSEQVQMAVFDRLIAALDEKTMSSPSGRLSLNGSSRSLPSVNGSAADSTDDVVHDLIVGENIHAVLDENT